MAMALAGPALAARKTPAIFNIIPKHATHLGGTSVTIIGEGFTGATGVFFGGTKAASFTVNSGTQITAVSPPGAEGASVHVTVVTPTGGSAETTADFFFYMKSCEEGHAPAVTSVEPNSGPAGTRVVIKGERFFEAVCSPPVGFSVERVFFGFTEATSFKRVKEGELEAFSPPGIGAVDVTVESFIGQSPVTPSDQFTGPGPVIYHWYRNGAKLAEGTAVPIVMFGGKINFSQNLVGEVNCKTVLGGTIENPVGGGAGVGRTNSMTFYECKAPTCEAEVMKAKGLEGRGRQTAENNPAANQEPAFPGWSDALEESSVAGTSSVREKIGEPWETYKTPSPPGMWRETEICEAAPTKEAVLTAIWEGELKPEIGLAKSGNLNGTTPAKPSQIKFNGAGTETLDSEVGGEGPAQGSVKYLGYFEQELITVKP
jgi:hypothetical protein